MSDTLPPSDDAPSLGVPHAVPPTAEAMSPEDLTRLLVTSGMMPTPVASDPPGKGSLHRKLFLAVLIAAIGIGASIMSCVGQSFSYRQAHALEGIEQQLKGIRASCSAVAPSAVTPSPGTPSAVTPAQPEEPR